MTEKELDLAFCKALEENGLDTYKVADCLDSFREKIKHLTP